MILLAETADPAYELGQAFGHLVFSVGLTLAIAYGAVRMVRDALRKRRDTRAGVNQLPVMYVPPSGTAYTSWGTPPPAPISAATTADRPARRPPPPFY